MKKLYRLLKAQDFKDVLDKRKCVLKNSSFSVYVSEGDKNHIQIGISVSTKVGNAVTRVKCRRQVRAMISTIDKLNHCYSLPLRIVIIVKKDYLKKEDLENFTVLKKVFSSLENTGELLKNEIKN